MQAVYRTFAFAAALSAIASLAHAAGPVVENTGPTVSIFFPSGATELTDEASAALNEAANAARESNAEHVIVVGYDDTHGDAKAREHIAAARAASVETGLVDHGIDPSIVSTTVGLNTASFNTAQAGGAATTFIDARRADIIMQSPAASGVTSGF